MRVGRKEIKHLNIKVLEDDIKDEDLKKVVKDKLNDLADKRILRETIVGYVLEGIEREMEDRSEKEDKIELNTQSLAIEIVEEMVKKGLMMSDTNVRKEKDSDEEELKKTEMQKAREETKNKLLGLG